MAGSDSNNADDAPKASASGAIFGLLLATLLAAGGGVYLGWSQFGPSSIAQPAKPEGAGEKYADGSRLRDLVAITTNLAGQPEAWIRLESTVVLAAAAEPSEDDEVMLRTLNEDVVAYLRTVSLQQIQGPSGFQSVREDLDERMRIRSEGKVQELIIHSMIIE